MLKHLQCLQDRYEISGEPAFKFDQTGSIAAPDKLTAAPDPWGQYGRQLGYGCEANADPFAGRTRGGKGEAGRIGKKTPVVVVAAEAATAPNSFDSLEDRQAQWELHKSLRRNSALSLIEDGLGPGNEAELSDHLLSSARPQQDRPTKADQHDNEHESSQQIKLATAFASRLDAGDSVYQITKTLEEVGKPKIGPSEGLFIKCKIAKAENPSAFCLNQGNDSSFVTDEKDVVEEDTEVPLEGAQPFGASTDSV